MVARARPESGQVVSTFLFADLAGFTALTEAHGDAAAASVAGDFCDRVSALAPGFGATVVKTIGDAVMIRAQDAQRAIELGVRISEGEGARRASPEVRVGMHTGAAVERGGDWYGGAVNLAARVVALAAGGEVVLTDATAESAGPLQGFDLERLGARRLKNIAEPVRLLRAVRRSVSRDARIVDPVCRMTIADGEWVGSIRFEGREYRFCSIDCARRFTERPALYAVQQSSSHPA
jgi:adenylate cyclase